MTNEHNINELIGKQITYRTAKSGHEMNYIIKKIVRTGSWFATGKVIDKSEGSKTGNKQVWKTFHYVGIEEIKRCD